MSQVFDSKEQESQFQEVFEKVNQIETYDKHLTENDLRTMFVAGIEFGIETFKKILVKPYE